MPTPTRTLVCRDATTIGKQERSLTLHDLDTTVTLRELIRHRVREELASSGRASGDHPLAGRGRPTGKGWEAQADAALRAFERNAFVVLVGDRQVDDLDARIDTSGETDVTFLKLVPLAGG